MNVRLRSHNFIPPSKEAEAATVLAAARFVVPEDEGKVVCKAVLVAARGWWGCWSSAAARPARAEMRRAGECILFRWTEMWITIGCWVARYRGRYNGRGLWLLYNSIAKLLPAVVALTSNGRNVTVLGNLLVYFLRVHDLRAVVYSVKPDFKCRIRTLTSPPIKPLRARNLEKAWRSRGTRPS